MKRRGILYLVVAPAVVALAVVAAAWFWAATGLDDARGYAEYELWPETRVALQRYLWIHPGEPTAQLLLAEALIKDESLSTDEAAEEAFQCLRVIPDEASEGSRARLQEGRIEFFVLCRPTRAERLFRRAAELDPETPEPYYMLWKLKDQTGRAFSAEPEFWKVYEASPVATKAVLLREWYMSQFYPSTANPLLDRLMGIAPTERGDANRTEAIRFIRFRNAEPDSPLGYAALARWFQAANDAKSASLSPLTPRAVKAHR